MKRINRFVALALALIMLLGMSAVAENESYYFTVSDPTFTDGVTQYDLTGLAATINVASIDDALQAVLSIATSAGALNGYALFGESGLQLFADGLSSVYTLTYEDMLKMISGIVGSPVLSMDEFAQVPDFDMTETSEASSIDINEMINTIFVYLNEFLGEEVANAETVTVDMLTADGVTAACVPVNVDAAMVDAILLSAATEIDASGMYEQIMQEVAGMLVSAGAVEDVQLPESCVKAYEQYIQPLKLNLTGDFYLSDMTAYAELTVNADTIGVLPLYFEVNAGEEPSMHMIADLTESGESVQVVLSVTGGTDAFAQIYIAENDIVIMQTQISRTYNDEYAADLYEAYFGVMADESTLEISLQYISDDATYRMMYAGLSVDDALFELNYDGVINSVAPYTETAQLSLNTTMGITGSLTLSFGENEAQPAEAFADGNVPVVNIASMSEEQAAQLETDGQTIISTLMTYLMYGVPGFAPIFEAISGGAQ